MGLDNTAREAAPQAGSTIAFPPKTPSHDNEHDATIAAHAGYYIRLLEAVIAQQRGAGVPDGGRVQLTAIRHCEIEQGNFLAAFETAMQSWNEVWSLSLARHLQYCLEMQAEFRKTQRCYAALVEQALQHNSTALEAAARLGLASAEIQLGDYDAVEANVSAGERLAQPGTAEWALLQRRRAQAAYYRGEFAQAHAINAECLTQLRLTGDLPEIASSLMYLSNTSFYVGDLAEARQMNEEALAIWHSLGNAIAAGNVIGNLGSFACMTGDYETAERYGRQCMEMCRAGNDRQNLAGELGNLGQLAALRGDWEAARALNTESLELRREIGDRNGELFAICNLGNVEYHLGNYGEARRQQNKAVKLSRAIGDKRGEAWALRNIGCIDYRQGHIEKALAGQHRSLLLRQECAHKTGMVSGCAFAGALLTALPDHLAKGAAILLRAEELAAEMGVRHELEVQQVVVEGLARISAANISRPDEVAGLDLEGLTEMTLARLKSLDLPDG